MDANIVKNVTVTFTDQDVKGLINEVNGLIDTFDVKQMNISTILQLRVILMNLPR